MFDEKRSLLRNRDLTLEWVDSGTIRKVQIRIWFISYSLFKTLYVGFMSSKPPKLGALNLQNSSEYRECMHFTDLNFIPFFLLVSTFPRFSPNSTKSGQWLVQLFKELNPRNVTINRKRGMRIKLHCLQKSWANSKDLGVKRLRTYSSNIITKVDFKKMNIWRAMA